MKPYFLSKVNEKGQGMLEYGLIIVLVAVLVMIILIALGPGIGNMFSNVVTNVQ
jgi:pilus assembly protein Flp/PilA